MTITWFDKLSKKAQAEYIKTHPNSKYAKGNKKATPIRGTMTAANIAKMKEKKPSPTGPMMVKLADLELKHFRQKDPVKKAVLKTQMVALKTKIKKILAESKTVSKVAAKGAAHEVKRATDKNKVVAKTPSAKAKTKLSALQDKLKDAKARLAEQRKAKRVTRSLPTLVKQLEDKVKEEKIKAKVKKPAVKKPAVKKPAVKKVVKAPSSVKRNGKPDPARRKAIIQQALRVERAKLKDTTAGTTTYKRIERAIAELKARM